MANRPNPAMAHQGSCRGKGLLMKAYHGFSTDGPGEPWQENLCACCDLTCRTCSTWARTFIQEKMHLDRDIPRKAPPLGNPYPKPPPQRRQLIFKGEAGQVLEIQNIYDSFGAKILIFFLAGIAMSSQGLSPVSNSFHLVEIKSQHFPPGKSLPFSGAVAGQTVAANSLIGRLEQVVAAGAG